ncbi:MATE efflux family protein 9 [Platanthera zijinensis]|uniref:Protein DETOXIFICATION n=1 Tax=Platanthera zijinensis TaxID=2320716 RepID=A0AAP0BUB6_9ASPA
MCRQGNAAAAPVTMAEEVITAVADAGSPLYTLLPISNMWTKTKKRKSGREEMNNPLPLPSIPEAIKEAALLFRLSFPIALTALFLYSRSIISMLFLGFLGNLPLASGSMAVAFANITGYSVLSGLSLGMEPLCSQAFGANQHKLLWLTLYRSVLFLLCSAIPISFLWLNMSKILLFLGQDLEIISLAQSYILFSLPDLFSFSIIHPIRIFLRSQGITRPLTFASAFAAAVNIPANFLLVTHLRLGVAGVAAASAASNIALLLCLCLYLHFCYFGLNKPGQPTIEWATGWGPLARLAAPSCVSVCLEWWWYELIILLCGLLPDPKPAVAAIGVLIQTTALLYVFPSSLGFGVSTRVGNELGANQPARARSAALVAVAAASGMGLAAMAFAAGMKDRWGSMFTNDGEILRLTAAALPIVGLCELGNCPQTVACGVLRGCARPAHAAHVNLGAFYLVGMPVAVGLGFWLGVGFCGFWIGLLVAQVSCAGLMLYVVWSTDWEAQACRAQMLTCAPVQLPAAADEEEKVEAEFAAGEKCFQPLVSIKVEEFER